MVINQSAGKTARQCAGCIVIIAIILSAAPLGAVPVSAQPDFDIQYDEFNAGSNGPIFTEDFKVETTGETTFQFGPGAATQIQISKQNTGEQVTLTPDNSDGIYDSSGETYSVTDIEINANDIVEDGDPVIQIETPNEAPRLTVEVEGDVDMFRNDTFAAYTVAITDQNGTPLATTEPQIHAVRYEVETRPEGIQYNGSALAVARDEEVQSDWYVELQQGGQIIREFQNVAGRDYFITSVEETEFNDSQSFRVNIYQDESDSRGQRLAGLFLLRIDEDTRVTGPVGTQSPPTEAPGDGSETPVELSVEAPETVQPGETLTVTAEVTNQDVPEASSGVIELTSVPEPLSLSSASANPVFLGFAGNALPAVGESVTQQFEIAVPDEAAVEQELTLETEATLQNSEATRNTTTTQTVTITDQQAPVERFDQNGEPGIQGDEVLDAISEFNEGGDVEATDVLDVISAFNENSG